VKRPGCVGEVRRRDLLALLAGAAALRPIALRAQQAAKVYRVGVLTPSATQWSPLEDEAFRETLDSLGYKDGANLIIEFRDAAGRLDELSRLAGELARTNVDVIVAVNTPGARAAIGASKTIPIVMATVGDPVGTGFVKNLPRPEGNVTGISVQTGELAAKRLQLLKEAVPNADRIVILMNPDDPVVARQIPDVKAAAGHLGVETQFLVVRDEDDLKRAFKTLVEWRAQAIFRLAGQAQSLAPLTIELALRSRLPTMLVTKSDVTMGALMSYDSDRVESCRRVAQYVDKILKGAKPADLPVEQPTKFELVINLKTAKALGLTVPQPLLQRADEVIE
jgi:putative tryptophan/tyrosine transport system substrate-binding protein